MLDPYGTNHNCRIWLDPEAFRPERFLNRPFDLNPHGGGEYATGHRCPGEPATVEILKAEARLLTGEMSYAVPD